MTAQTKATIKSYFQTGDKPTQSQFEDFIDSYIDTLNPVVSGASIINATIVSANITNSTLSNVSANIVGGTITNVSANLVGGAIANVTASAFNIVGVTDGSNKAAGRVGEVVSSLIAGAGTALTSNQTNNITFVPLSAGDWSLSAIINFVPAASTSITTWEGGISTASSAFPSVGTLSLDQPVTLIRQAAIIPGNNAVVIPIAQARVNITTSANYYLVVRSTFTVSTMTAGGYLLARRLA